MSFYSKTQTHSDEGFTLKNCDFASLFLKKILGQFEPTDVVIFETADIGGISVASSRSLLMVPTFGGSDFLWF